MKSESPEAIAQTYLAELGLYQGALDAIWGPLSQAAARTYIARPDTRISPIVAARQATLAIAIAQLALQDTGMYSGDIDGYWGPLSKRAALANAKGLLHPMFHLGQRYIGCREIPGKEHNGTILSWYRKLQTAIYNDEVAWCSTFINYLALECGYERTGSLDARSWLQAGIPVSRSAAMRGDVIIFRRGTSSWEGHVALVDRISETHAWHLGGNQSNSVSIARSSLSTLLGIRRLRTLEPASQN